MLANMQKGILPPAPKPIPLDKAIAVVVIVVSLINLILLKK